MLLDRIIAEIHSGGPIGFDRFMEMALYDPDAGYFTTGALRSDRGGDFLTSPEVSPMFGEAIARFVAAEHDRVGRGFSITEVGGGSGSLLRPLLDALEFPIKSVVAAERSEAARHSIARTVPEAVFADDIPRMRGIVVANELLDNFPAAIVERSGGCWVERVVTFRDDALAWDTRSPRAELVEWATAHGGVVPEGGLVEVQLEATRWITAALARIQTGALVLIDYGDLTHHLEGRREHGTVRTYRGHHLGPDPLTEPGSTDVTMDVSFTALLAAAEAAGATTEFLRQDDFLEQWGLGDRLRELKEAELSAAREGRVMEQLILRSQITEGETLIHPRGLGDFRVLICRK